MGTHAKDSGPVGHDLPNPADVPPTGGDSSVGEAPPPTPDATRPPARHPHGEVSLAEVLAIPALATGRVVAGHAGLTRTVEGLNVMEVPDIWDWAHPRQLLLTTGYPLREVAADLGSFFTRLEQLGLAGVVLKPNRYIPAPDAEALAVADQLGFPVVLLGDGVGFDEILHQGLSLILDRRAEQLAHSERVLASLVDIVVSGGGLADLCRGLVDDVADAAVVTTMDGRVLAHALRASDSTQALRASDSEADEAGVTTEELFALPCFDRTGRLRVEDEPTGVVASGPLSRLSVPVTVRGRQEGRLVVVRRRAITAADLGLVQQAAASAALVMSRQAAVAAVENKYRADFLRDALAGHAGEAGQVRDHASTFGWDLERDLVVVTAHATPPAPGTNAFDERSLQDRFSRAWEQAVRAADPAAAVAGYANEVVAVVGVAPGAPRAEIERRVGEFARTVRGDGGGGRRPFSTGISRIFHGPAALPQAYLEATKAASVGARTHGLGSVTHFDSLGAYRLLSLVPPGELRAFAEETLGPVSARTPEGDDLRHTLETLLDHNLNVAEASRALHFHYNTLRYRITKLEQLLGPFTSDPHLCFSLSLALHVMQMRGLEDDLAS